MIKLNVWLAVDLDSTPEKAGELIVSGPDEQGRLIGQFRYIQEYIASPKSFALDPVNLPVTRDIFNADRPHSGVHGVFEDSLPDDWGRRMLVRRFALPRTRQRVPDLLRVLQGNGMGALLYSEDDNAPKSSPLTDSKQLVKLEQLARRFETDPLAVDDDLAMLFQAASYPGGARPKVLVHDSNGSYLAKFASTKDIFDVVSLEAATMHLAENAGLYVAKTRCSPCGPRQALLVNRFDVDPTTRKRHHCISMQSLLRADGYYNLFYADMASVLRKISADPSHDQLNLFRQMVFNVLIGNTDDHLKNFTMLHADHGWRLSPAYDLLPNIGLNSEHVLRIGLDSRVPDRQTLISEAKRFGLKQMKKIEEEISNIFAAVANWRKIFNNYGVPEEDILRLGKDIENRLAKCSGS